MQHFTRAAAAAVATIILITPSCGPKLVPEREIPKPVYLTATPEELLFSLRERNSAIQGLQADGHLDYRFTYSRRGYSGTNVKFQFSKPDKVYVRGYARVAGTLFILVSDGKNFWVEDTGKRKAYTGQAQNSVRTEGDAELWEGVHPTVLAEALLLDDFESAQIICETYPSHYIITLLEQAENGKLTPRRELWFDRTNLRVVRHRIFTKAGLLRTEATFARYTQIGGFELPQYYRINRPWEELSLTLELRDVKINPDLDEELFQYQVPKGFEIEDLQQKETDNAKPS